MAGALASWWPIVLWLVPLLLTRWVYWLIGYIEHTGLTHRADPLLNTRTTKTNALMHWVTWNVTYHTAHHSFPNVPFHGLPALQREIQARFPRVAEQPVSGLLRFHWDLIRRLARGETELDIVAKVEAELDKSDP